MSEQPKLQEGDVVMLKSGGPRMTIERIYEPTGSAKCIWFGYVGELEACDGKWFKLSNLMLAPEVVTEQ